MTAYKARLNGRTPATRNKKDGATGRRPKDRSDQFEALGFTLIEPPAKWSYTWQGVFPVFQVKPGIINGLGGIVARCETANVAEWFPYGTSPDKIKARLDDLVLEIMRSDAADEPIDWAEWKSEGLAYDF
jgi:hypothetical protein